MVWLGLIGLVYMAAIAPITLQLRIRWFKGFSLQMRGHIWGMPFTVKGERLQKKGAHSEFVTRLEWGWQTLRLSRGCIQWLLRRIRIEYVDLRLRVNTGRADLTALSWGAGKALAGILESQLDKQGVPAYIALQPEFGNAPSALEGGCILFVRLGTLLLAGLVLGLNALRVRGILARQTGEEEKWITQSGA